MPSYPGLMDPRVVQALAEATVPAFDAGTPEGRAASTAFLADLVQRATGRSCMGCTLCCKLSGIPELNKPDGQWCSHCDTRSGCRIYAQRPGSCRDFVCLWRAGYGPDEMKPSEVRVMGGLEEKSDGSGRLWHLDVEPSRPDAWRSGVVREFLEAVRDTGEPVVVRIGRRVIRVPATGLVDSLMPKAAGT